MAPRKRLPKIVRNTRSDRDDADIVSTSTEPTEDESRVQARRTFMQRAREHFKLAVEFWSPVHKDMLEDRRFAASDQWEPSARSMREAAGKPVITINQLPGIINQITNPSMLSMPAATVSPVDSSGDKATAEVIQDLIRTIERNSDAVSAYFRGHRDQTEIGLGFWRLLREYESDESFDQVLRIRRVRNPFSVLFDPTIQDVDFRDADFAFVYTDLTKDQFTQQFGSEALTSLEAWGSTVPEIRRSWMLGSKIRIAEYFYVDIQKVTIVGVAFRGPDGTVVRKVIPKSVCDATKAQLEAVGGVVYNEREIVQRTVKWAKISGSDILVGNADKTAGREWGGPYIPIVPVVGLEVDINGQLDFRGVVRDAKSPCRLLNYTASAIAEAVGSAPKSPFLIEFSQLQGLENYWKKAQEGIPYLPYKGKAIDGRLVPPPQRLSTEAQIQALVQAYSLAEAQLRATTAMYEDVLGQQGNERSGKAILARQSRSDVGASHFQQNWHRAIKFTGEQIISLLPTTYTAERIERIIGADGTVRRVMIAPGAKPAPPQGMTQEAWLQKQGIVGVFDIAVGRYDVSVSAGPSYPARRQEAQAALVEMVKSFPQVFPVIGDLMAEYSDWPGSEKIAARLRKMMDPKLLDTGEPMSDPAAEAKIQALTTQLEALSQRFQQAQQIIETDAHKLSAQVQMKQIETSSRERIEAAKLQVEAATVLATLDAKKAETLLKAEMARLEGRLELLLKDADLKMAAKTQGDDDGE